MILFLNCETADVSKSKYEKKGLKSLQFRKNQHI